MEHLQNKVYNKQALGSAGQIAKGLHSYFLMYSKPAKDNSVCAGCFVQSSDNGFIIGASGNAITGRILGVAIKDHYISSVNTTAVFAKNDIVSYLDKGVIFIESESVCKEGQYVFLKNDNGALAFDNATTKADHTFTGFHVVIGTGDAINAAGHDIIAIQRD